MKHFNVENKGVKAAAILQIWTVACCMIPNVWLTMADGYPLWSALTNIIFPAGLYLLLMSLTAKVGRASLWMTPLYVLAAFQMVLLYMYGRSVIAVDMFLNVVTTNPGEVGELLGNLLLIIFVIVVIFVPPIAMAVVAAAKHYRLSEAAMVRGRKCAMALMALGVATYGLSYTSARHCRVLDEVYPVNAFYNLGTAVHRTLRVAKYHQTSANFKFDARSERADSMAEVYVLVVGETSRAANWQLCGYERQTTPRLAEKEGLVAYRHAISQSNTTHKSVPMLLSHVDAKEFGDSIYYIKGIISAFKEAGYHTAFFSNQSRNHSFIDFFGEEADTCVFVKENLKGEAAASPYDADMLPLLESQLRAGHKKLLVVLHAYGSHFNYIDRYPREQAKFLPDRPAPATFHSRPKLINAYDNTILYTSNFLADIIDRLEAAGVNAAMIYTSDHGEDVFDDDRHLFLHASPIASYYQLHVPMVVWLSESYRAAYPKKAEALKGNVEKFVSPSRVYFHTALDMAGLKSPKFRPEWSLMNSDYRPGDAIYLNDHNDAVGLRESGLLEQDFVRLDKLNIP